MKGFTAPTTHGKWSLRASATGELVFDKDAAVTAARTKSWRKADTYYSPFKRLHNKFIIPVLLKPYYRRQMLARFTPEAIEANWLQADKGEA